MTIDEFRKKYGPLFGRSDTRVVDAIIKAETHGHSLDSLPYSFPSMCLYPEPQPERRQPKLKLIIGGKSGK